MAPVRGFHDGSGKTHGKAEYTNATAPLVWVEAKASAGWRKSGKPAIAQARVDGGVHTRIVSLHLGKYMAIAL